MLELELFFKTVEAKIREEHCNYLEAIKREALSQPPKGFFNRLFRKRKIAVEEKLLKSYNRGIHKALSVLKREFKAFDKRLKKEDKGGGKF